MIGAPRLCGELLRFLDRFGRLQQIVDARHRREIDRADIVADELAKRQVHSAALNVTRRVERQYARVDVVEQRLEVRGSRLVQGPVFLYRYGRFLTVCTGLVERSTPWPSDAR